LGKAVLTDCRREMGIAALALKRYRLRHGEWPPAGIRTAPSRCTRWVWTAKTMAAMHGRRRVPVARCIKGAIGSGPNPPPTPKWNRRGSPSNATDDAAGPGLARLFHPQGATCAPPERSRRSRRRKEADTEESASLRRRLQGGFREPAKPFAKGVPTDRGSRPR
jgi:hypothetical protein